LATVDRKRIRRKAKDGTRARTSLRRGKREERAEKEGIQSTVQKKKTERDF